MLEYNILYKKPVLNRNNETYLDLAQPSFNNKSNIQGEALVVNKYYVARPDLISLAIYGDDKYADIICKINGISNPFELNENDLIFVPAIDEISGLTKFNTKPSNLVETSNKLVNNKQDVRKKVSDKRSPNQMTVNDANYIIDHSLGLVFY